MMKNNLNIHGSAVQSYYETKKHTGFLFPYNVYLCTIPDDFPSVFPHWQDTMEIIYIKKGQGLAQVDLSVFEVQEGDIILAPPGHIHGLEHIPGRHMEYENIIFDLAFLGSGTMDLCSQNYLLPLKQNRLAFPPHITPGHAYYVSIAGCLDDADMLCSQKPVGYELGVKADMLRLFSFIFRSMDTGTAGNECNSPQNIARMKHLLQFMEENYQRPISVEEAAHMCNYSASHFMRWFRRMTGTSFVKYLNRFRLNKALEELKNTDRTVLEISQRSGFDNLSNFNRLFKKQFQKTPRELRSPGHSC